ncbi:MAG: CopG family transcriptional regulator [Acidimicrobiales bacterium]
MRTTIALDDDVAAAVGRLRQERSAGLSEVVNDLVRAGLRASSSRPTFRQRSTHLGLRIDVANVAEALDALEGPGSR